MPKSILNELLLFQTADLLIMPTEKMEEQIGIMEVIGVKYSAICVFLALGYLSFICCKNSATGMIKSVGTNKKYYPNAYVSPNPKIKRFFKITQHFVPKYLYVELYISFAFAFLGIINSLIYICSGMNKSVAGFLIMIHISFVLADFVIFSIFSWAFRRKQ